MKQHVTKVAAATTIYAGFARFGGMLAVKSLLN